MFTETVDIPFDPFQATDWPFALEDEAAYNALRDRLHGREHLFGYPEHASLYYNPTPAGRVPLLSVPSPATSACWARTRADLSARSVARAPFR